MIEYEAIVVGGGPAGLMAAIQAKLTKPELSLAILEKGPRVGRKLIVAGSGQCNFTHIGETESFLGRFGGGSKPPGDPDEDGQRAPGTAGRFLKPALYAFPPEDFIAWLSARGVASVVDDYNGKVYPASRRSLDVLSAFTTELKALQVPIELNAGVSRVSRQDDWFVLHGEHEDFRCRHLLLATGGHTYQLTGSSGDGWNFARTLGHNVSDFGPALAPVHVEKFSWVDCAGISFRHWPLEIRDGERLVARNRGDVLITHTGLSGPGIIDASRWIRPGHDIIIPLGPFGSQPEAEQAVMALAARSPKRLVRTLVAELCQAERLADHLCALADIDAELRASSLDRDRRRLLCRYLAGTSFKVSRLGGLDEAMASRGGVSLDEVDPRSMQSRIVPGLFFAGEVLDVDGDSGGFNIQAACSTGYVAGRALAAGL
ncbi:MAG: aminoacetone oxidase family FAD-binding enzyme [Spirochaetes bacterium]|nr:aminoacetone oxidase family FAD-binding enzyme [Spirochaetota bacterium]MBU0955461.1 aminoacetone oxidase family FAD-binding enzyme [Spirochaetota bacterium]